MTGKLAVLMSDLYSAITVFTTGTKIHIRKSSPSNLSGMCYIPTAFEKKKIKIKRLRSTCTRVLFFLLFLSPRFSLQTFSWHTAPLANHFELRSKRILLSETLGHSWKFKMTWHNT